MQPLIVPSVLPADFARLGDEVRELCEAGVDRIQWDVMDGVFVPNLTFGPDVIAAARPHSTVGFEAHLMVVNPDELLGRYVDAGCELVIVHAEACTHLHRTLARIQDLGARSGVALNPHTPVEVVEHVLPETDLVLAMTVNPGFGGQSYIGAVEPKIARLRRMIDESGLPIELEVDGGITVACCGDREHVPREGTRGDPMTNVLQPVFVPSVETDRLAVDTLRFLAADMVQAANSGHPGMPMGAAPMAWTLWSRHLRHDPAAPDWADRDRFVLSAGHGSALLYGLLHIFGYELPEAELRSFRQLGSRTPGHPEYGDTPGVECTTGPLGQGLAMAGGMALAERMAHARYPEITDHYTYVIVGDGCLMEGISHEAASLAGHLGLGRLVVLWDDNAITIDGSVDRSCSDDQLARFAAYGWHTEAVLDGTDIDAIDHAITRAKADPRPSFIAVRTVIGNGAPGVEGTANARAGDA